MKFDIFAVDPFRNLKQRQLTLSATCQGGRLTNLMLTMMLIFDPKATGDLVNRLAASAKSNNQLGLNQQPSFNVMP